MIYLQLDPPFVCLLFPKINQVNYLQLIEEEEPLLIYTAQGSPFRCKKLSVINGSPERNNVLKLCIHMHYTYTNNNIDRKLCTNKRFRSK